MIKVDAGRHLVRTPGYMAAECSTYNQEFMTKSKSRDHMHTVVTADPPKVRGYLWPSILAIVWA